MKILSKKLFSHFLILALFIGGGFSIAQSQYGVLDQGITTQGTTATTNNQQKLEFFVDWSAQTYVPADYNGKALPTYGSQITLFAMALSPINESDYIFNWVIDSSFTPSNNGEPLANFTVRKNTGGEHIVFLTIRNKKDRAIIREKSIIIPITSPEAIVYKENSNGSRIPLLIPIDIGNFTNAGSRLNLIVKPFSFNKINSSQLLKYNWKLNGKKIAPLEAIDNLLIDFLKEIPSGTQYDLMLTIENPSDVYQSVNKRYKITVK